MGTKLSILIFLLSLNFGTVAQGLQSFECKDTTIELFTELNSEVELLLFENSVLQVKTSLIEFRRSVEAWLEIYPQLKQDRELLDLVTEKSAENDRVNVIRLASEFRLTERLEFRLADILDSGKCIIIEKKNKTIAKEINRETYSYVCGPTCGNGGRIYSFDTIEFFRVMDWIS